MRKPLAGLTAAAVTVGLLIGNVGAAEAATPASNSVGVLMNSYNPNTGRIGSDWWTSAVSLSTVMTYRQSTGDARYDYAISEAFAKNPDFTNEYIDDTGWWALVWIQAYDITGNRAYLAMAETTTQYMRTFWDSECGGGVYWRDDKRYKASIANELFLAATAGLHNRIPGDTTYLSWANEEWNWFKNSGLINNNLVRDGRNVPGCGYSNANYTYNQGVILHGLIELSKATGDTSLLTTAKSIATAAVNRFNRNNVLYEGCEPNCAGDGQAFKGIFIRYLRALATATNTIEYDSFITATANSILANNTNSSGQQGNSFVGPFALWSPTTQAASAAALIAALGSANQPTNNLALNKVATADSSCAAAEGPARAVNGSVSGGTTDKWCSAGANKYLQVDLGANHNVNRFVVQHAGAGGENTAWNTRDFTLQTSTDASSWTTRTTVSANTASTTTHPITAVTARYVRLNITTPASDGNTAARIYELEVYGTTGTGGSGTITGIGGKCLDVNGSGTADGTKIQLWTCNTGAAQQWTRTGDTFRALGKCLDVSNGGTANGTLVQLWTCNNSGAQVWLPQTNGSILNPQSGKVLDAAGASSADGTQIHIWQYAGGANQHWTINGTGGGA